MKEVRAMVIQVTTFRGLDINIAQLELGDVLEVTMANSNQILLLPIKDPNSCMRRWCYAAKHMLPGDVAQRDEIARTSPITTCAVGRHKIADASINVYINFNVSLDRPLTCTVSATWPDDCRQRPDRRELGRFDSVGGPVLTVTPTTLSARA